MRIISKSKGAATSQLHKLYGLQFGGCHASCRLTSNHAQGIVNLILKFISGKR